MFMYVFISPYKNTSLVIFQKYILNIVRIKYSMYAPNRDDILKCFLANIVYGLIIE